MFFLFASSLQMFYNYWHFQFKVANRIFVPLDVSVMVSGWKTRQCHNLLMKELCHRIESIFARCRLRFARHRRRCCRCFFLLLFTHQLPHFHGLFHGLCGCTEFPFLFDFTKVTLKLRLLLLLLLPLFMIII